MISAMHANLAASLDSPNNTIPSAAVPTAPMPVHTAYAVPMGSCFVACASNTTLAVPMASTYTLGHSRVNPCVDFNPIAHATSNALARIKYTQAMSYSPGPAASRARICRASFRW